MRDAYQRSLLFRTNRIDLFALQLQKGTPSVRTFGVLHARTIIQRWADGIGITPALLASKHPKKTNPCPYQNGST